jgi:hypothetical protein
MGTVVSPPAQKAKAKELKKSDKGAASSTRPKGKHVAVAKAAGDEKVPDSNFLTGEKVCWRLGYEL